MTNKINIARKVGLLLCTGACSILNVIGDNNGTQKPFSVKIKQSIHPSLNEFAFKLDCYEDDMQMYYTKTIRISDTKTGKEIQTLKTNEFNDGADAQTTSRDAVELLIEDLNFDGFADIRINSFVSAGPNNTYICWLWDTEKDQFVYNKTLSEIIALKVDPKNKWLHSYSRINAATYREEFYKYMNGKPTLYKIIEEQFDDNGQTAEVVIQELKNGQLIETERGQRKIEKKYKPVGANLLDNMEEKEWKALNIFFSNFEETGLENFNSKSYDEKSLIDFALQHNVLNNKNRFRDDDPSGEYYLPEHYVIETLQKYFGIEKITAQDGTNAELISYNKGKYFWLDIFEGSPRFAGSQVIEFYDNQDGTFLAVVAEYKDNYEFQTDPDRFSSAFYTPKKAWEASTAQAYELSGYHIAKITTHTYNGQKAYKLLERRAAETFDELQTILHQMVSANQTTEKK